MSEDVPVFHNVQYCMRIVCILRKVGSKLMIFARRRYAGCYLCAWLGALLTFDLFECDAGFDFFFI